MQMLPKRKCNQIEIVTKTQMSQKNEILPKVTKIKMSPKRKCYQKLKFHHLD